MFRDPYPAWALRTNKNGDFLPPDQETQDLQRKIMAFSMRLRNHIEGQPLETGLEKMDHFLEPAWNVDAAEEFDVIQSEPNILARIFDEPERPIGAFDKAEVAYWMERERQGHLSRWKKQGYSKDELDRFQHELFHMTPAELDERAKSAREALIASRKLLVVQPYPVRPALSKKKKGKQPMIDSEEDIADGQFGRRRSKRTRTSYEEPEEISPTSMKRLDDELDQLSAESDDQEMQENDQPGRRTSHNSNTSNGSGKRVIFKLDGKVIEEFMWDQTPSKDREPAGEETEDAMDVD